MAGKVYLYMYVLYTYMYLVYFRLLEISALRQRVKLQAYFGSLIANDDGS